MEGSAFCFLPLPVRTGLPCHVNAFFELSTNRRDIWYGADLQGGGQAAQRTGTPTLLQVASARGCAATQAACTDWLQKWMRPLLAFSAGSWAAWQLSMGCGLCSAAASLSLRCM